jgi:hypothetical protein
MRLQNAGGCAASVADDRGEHNGAVDVAPAAASRGGGGGFENALDILRYTKLARWSPLAWARPLHRPRCNARAKPLHIDVARIENGNRIGVGTKRLEQMLQSHFSRSHRFG